MLPDGSLGKTLLTPTPGQAQLFKPSNSSTSTSCSIITAKNGFRHQTTMLQSLALLTPTRTLALFPYLNLIASLRVRQDVENGDANAHPSLPLQRRVTKQNFIAPNVGSPNRNR